MTYSKASAREMPRGVYVGVLKFLYVIDCLRVVFAALRCMAPLDGGLDITVWHHLLQDCEAIQARPSTVASLATFYLHYFGGILILFELLALFLFDVTFKITNRFWKWKIETLIEGGFCRWLSVLLIAISFSFCAHARLSFHLLVLLFGILLIILSKLTQPDAKQQVFIVLVILIYFSPCLMLLTFLRSNRSF